MSERFINGKNISKLEAYDRAIGLARKGKKEESEMWFSLIESWQHLPTREEHDRFVEYRGFKRRS